MKYLVATFFFSGYLKPAPGTWGSLAALPVFWALHVLGGPIAVAVGVIAAFALGLWATKGVTAETGIEDPSFIVIDEVVGMWIALLPTSIGAAHAGADVLALYPGLISAFVLFRLFDIWKPWLVGRADRRGDPMGVMLDDVWAGVFAGIVTLAIAALSHLVIQPMFA